ncbi:MAG: G/T mismatches repair enzyme [Candidatus Methanofastidiosum methylothiophilum]|jgi:endonuclease-3 related protein|uniref:G/T mismatches repair enzyme n=1 Tax=Candidatus Methanofastidiosum methylothiophilum TaxID=1705564 RepID=A0A150JNU8_9EURY|nr:MAG: G/T mismatches repair enzyme [Candidatus Methanofastidiosum methylthiophilus]MBP6932390.1 endonuclease [Methanofastidiosum sp.]OQC52264.1 MAG: G/T mismatches repair enzyme [Euryarchaeota archaeon ADurb.Bin023]KYC57617.1 MAG: G/T mismatches repair enzyme [Candidatus Methanofastidiosum methylthiophilus]KYC58494.1 MAG: G/T mismatches repair enzyme [Candidatus Methanofastidiosum methylthiophilus]
MKSFEIYIILKNHFGEIGSWWPKDSPFEVVIGAILTQQSTWTNVEKAIKNLKEENILTPRDISSIPLDKLKHLIKPSGFFNQKAERLKGISEYILKNYKGDINLLLSKNKAELREELLKFKGVGKETADSIILYAAEKNEFVVDAYTKRLYSRLGNVEENIEYDDLKKYIITEIPEELKLYQEFHGLIVLLGKNLCKKKNPKCISCPLASKCNFN